MRFLLPLLLLLTARLSFAQEHQPIPVRWGAVSEAELTMKECVYDKTANAVVLCDFGRVDFIGNGKLTITRHVRLKILKDQAKDRANIVIPYFVKNHHEQIGSIKAQTINVDEKGKTVKIPVEAKQFFDADRNENWKEKRFAFPAVQAGSILEYTYTTVSKSLFSLESWTFASDIPTMHSEFRANIPEGLDYRILFQGANMLKKYGEKPTSQWSLKYLPALKEEPHVYNHLDYADRIQFQLAGYTSISNGISSYVTLMTSWEKLAADMLKEDGITRYLNRTGVAKNTLSGLIDKNDPDQEKVRKIYDHVRNTFNWSGKYAVFSEKPLNTVLESTEANSAEINLYLVVLLREAGLDAHPLLISTRRHGRVKKAYPLLNQFNHVLACVQIGGKDVLLDAIDRRRPHHLLAVNDLNEEGFLLDAKNPRWVPIAPPGPTREVIGVKVNLANPDKASYTIDLRLEDYAALSAREKLHAGESEKKFAEGYLRFDVPEFNLQKFDIAHKDDLSQPLQLTYLYAVDYAADATPGIVYFQPIVLNIFKDNPFKAENRYYPVEFQYPSSLLYLLNLTLPTGYGIDEMPKEALVRLPGNLGDFTYQIQQDGPTVQVLAKVNFTTSSIPQNNYPQLRQFYDIIGAKFKEPIVLKKL